MKKIYKLFGISLLTITFLFSCKQEIVDNHVKNDIEETITEKSDVIDTEIVNELAYIKLNNLEKLEKNNISQNNVSRLATPDLYDFTDEKFTFELAGIWKSHDEKDQRDEEVIKTWTKTSDDKTAYENMLSDTITIDAGQWIFTLNAKIENNIIYTKTITQIISSGQNILAFGKMEEPSEGKGTIKVSLTFPADSDCTKVVCELYDMNYEAVEGFSSSNLTVTKNPDDEEKNIVYYEQENVPVGKYRIKFFLYNDDDLLLNRYPEVVYVSNYNESHSDCELKNVNRYYKITYHNLDNSFNGVSGFTLADDYSLPRSYTIDQTVSFPDSTQLTKGNYFVDAWYTTEDMSDTPITGWNCDEMAQNIDLYPRWCTTGEKAADAIAALPAPTESTVYTIRVKDGVTTTNLSNIVTQMKSVNTNTLVDLDLQETSGITTISSGLFRNVTSLHGIDIPKTVTTIENYAFNGCTGLKEVNIEDGSTELSLGYNTYNNENTSSVGKGLFYDCPIEKLYLGRNITCTAYSSNYSNMYGYAPFARITSIKTVEMSSNVTKINAYEFYYCGSLFSISGNTNITIIDKNAFQGCRSLAEIDIPVSVTTINSYAFSNCAGLTEVNFDSEAATSIGTYAFVGCTSLAKIDIPAKITTIGNYAFNGCTGLKEVTIEDGSTALSLGYNTFNNASTSSVGKGLFYDCPIEKLYLGRNITCTAYSSNYSNMYGYAPFTGIASLKTVEMSSKVTKINAYEFYNCKSLVSVSGNTNITIINNSAFSGCSSLSKITVPSTVTTINSYAFNGCTGLKEVNIEDGSTAITLGYNYSNNSTNSSVGKGLFYDCPIEKLHLGRNVEYSYGSTSYPNYYGYSAFAYNKKMAEVTIGSKVTSISAYTFYNCTGDKTIVIPSSVTSIGTYAFANSGITEITMPSTVTSIGAYGFQGNKFTSFKIPAALETINYGTFMSCALLESIKIPSNITTISDYAFNGCTGLKEVTIEDGSTALTLGYNTLNNADTTKIGKGLFYDCPIEKLYLGRNISCSAYKASYPCNYGYAPFTGITSLTSVTMSSKVTKINAYEFYNCESLVSVSGNTNITIINNSAFSGCSSLSKITVPSTVTTINSYAFNGCTGLKEVNIEDGSTAITLGYNYANNSTNSSVGKGLFYDCPIEKLHLGRNITYSYSTNSSPNYYGYSAFAYNKKLKTLTFGSKVTSIPQYTFYSCGSNETYNLNVTIPSSVTLIYPNAFLSCSLKTLTLSTVSGKHWIMVDSSTGTSSYGQPYMGTDTTGITANANWIKSGSFASKYWRLVADE